MSVAAVLLTLGSLLLLVVGATIFLVLKDAAAKEAAAVLPECTRNLISRAKDQLPEGARERFEEEWLAGFEEAIEKRPAWALAQAISLYRGARQISRELKPAPAPSGAGRPAWGSFASGTAKLSEWASTARSSRTRRWATRMVEAISEMLPPQARRRFSPRTLLAGSILYLPLLLRVIFNIPLFSIGGAIFTIGCCGLAVYIVSRRHE